MTNDELQYHIKAIESAIDAGVVEHKECGSSFFKTEYLPVGKPGVVARIKPTPREVYGVEDSSGTILRLYFSKGHMAACGGARVATFREVIE